MVPQKKKATNQRCLTLWYNSQTWTSKKKTYKVERKWYCTLFKDLRLAWKNSLLLYKNALCKTRTSYYSSNWGKQAHTVLQVFKMDDVTRMALRTVNLIRASLNHHQFGSLLITKKAAKLRSKRLGGLLIKSDNECVNYRMQNGSRIMQKCCKVPIKLLCRTTTLDFPKNQYSDIYWC